MSFSSVPTWMSSLLAGSRFCERCALCILMSVRSCCWTPRNLNRSWKRFAPVREEYSAGENLLSKREMEVVRSVAQGLTNREIAERLGLSQHTVKNYLFRVFDKLGVSSRVELLFMTLSRDSPSQSVGGCFWKNCTDQNLQN